tara:strand:- start:41 stop:379 length:339 start_codon:yes stop_codon:yes gene_type:complete
MAKLANMFKNLCQPALIYLIISVVSLLVIGSQNISNGAGYYCVGNYECNTSSKFTIFMFKILYILFWTFVLNCICKAGYKGVSWFLVLFPIILMFVLIALVLLNSAAEPLII